MGQSRETSSASEEPLFNIGAVSRMTNIPETTLRVWERRYDFPKSSRTAGGHRLYSQQDVTRLQWVKMRLDEGMQVSQAIRALQHVEREGNALSIPVASHPFMPREGHADVLDAFRKRLVDALVQHDTEQANQVLAEGIVLFPVEYLILDVIGPALHDIGEGWSEGRIDIATEHYATNHLRHHLLMWMRTGPPAYPVNPVVLACAPGELHEGSLLMLGVLLRRLRWPVVYLGQSMPIADLPAFIADLDAAVIVFVAMTEETAHALADWPHWMPQVARSKKPIVTYGGRIFAERPELAEQMSGVLLGRTLQEGVEMLDGMLHEMNPLLH